MVEASRWSECWWSVCWWRWRKVKSRVLGICLFSEIAKYKGYPFARHLSLRFHARVCCLCGVSFAIIYSKVARQCRFLCESCSRSCSRKYRSLAKDCERGLSGIKAFGTSCKQPPIIDVPAYHGEAPIACSPTVALTLRYELRINANRFCLRVA